MHVCPECHGKMMVDEDLCSVCKGRGVVLKVISVCPTCVGKRVSTYGGKCHSCKGVGYMENLKPMTSEPKSVRVADIIRVMPALLSIQDGEVVSPAAVVDDDNLSFGYPEATLEEPTEDDMRAMAVAGALVGYSLSRSEEGFPRGWMLNNILETGGRVIFDVSGIWHLPQGSDFGVQIYRHPVVEES